MSLPPPPVTAPSPHRPSLGLIGAGAFGQFMVPFLRNRFRVVLADRRPDLTDIADRLAVEAGTFVEAARQPVVVVAVPVQAMETVVGTIAPHVSPGALVLDVGSVKVKPAQLLSRLLPAHADIVCTHPLFGPQSARHGIEGMKISICAVRGRRSGLVARFCRRHLGLVAIETTPERHDRELAYVQGITHLIGKTLLGLELDNFEQTTVSYDLLRRAVGFIADDSAELFRAIELENPYALEARTAFFDAVRRVETALHGADGEAGTTSRSTASPKIPSP